VCRQDDDFGLTKAGFEREPCRVLGKGDYLSDLICSRSIWNMIRWGCVRDWWSVDQLARPQ
jgi:hypothetical protein